MKKYRVALWMVELEDGLTRKQINNVLDLLEEDEAGYLPLELEGECHSVAIGFICASYYEELGYSKSTIEKVIVPVLEDWDLEEESKEYKLSDGTLVYMGCDYETLSFTLN